MERDRFHSYCDRLIRMKTVLPEWFKRSESIIADYLQESCLHGFGQVLKRLLLPAYRIIEDRGGKVTGEEGELCELASLLSATVRFDDYRFNAYYFAICVVASSFFGVPVDKVDCDAFDENDLMHFDCAVSVEEETDPQRKQLKRFGIRLLDFSRTNQLVNFRQIKRSTLELISANPLATLYRLFRDGARIYLADWRRLPQMKMVYKCKLCGKTELFSYDHTAKKAQPARACAVCDANNTHNRKSMLPIRERLFRLPGEGYRCECGKTLTREALESNGLKCPDCGRAFLPDSAPFVTQDELKAYDLGELVSTIGGTQTADVAKNLLNKAKSMDRNFGLHVLYLAHGFLKWKDANGTEYNSPLLLCPINLNVDKTKGLYYFEVDPSANGTFEVNKTLAQMLSAYSRTCSVALPPLDPTDVSGYFTRVRRALREGEAAITDITRDWEIDPGFGIGLFHYQKLQLQHDIEENEARYLQHPIVRRLCGDEHAPIASPAERERNDTRYVMLDADSSQEAVIKAAQEGKSFILQGPPGSGKSQTITNIITSALGEGKRVLFVTEKASARSVIADNLRKSDPSQDKAPIDYVLDFDSFRKHGGAVSRTAFIEELNGCLKNYTPACGYDDQLLTDEKLRYEQLCDFMRQMSDQFDGHNYLRLLQDMAQYAPYAPLDEIDAIPSDRLAFAKLCDAIERYYATIATCGDESDYHKHTLYGCKGDPTNELYKVASEYGDVCAEIASMLAALRAYGWNADPDPGYLRTAAAQARLWAGMPRLTAAILDGLDMRKIGELYSRAADRCKTRIKIEKGEASADYLTIDGANFAAFDLSSALKGLRRYRLFLRRAGDRYQEWIDGILACFKTHNYERDYRSAEAALKRLEKHAAFLEMRTKSEQEGLADIAAFGYLPTSSADWEKLVKALTAARKILSAHDGRVFDCRTAEWKERFFSAQYYATVKKLRSVGDRLDALLDRERMLAKALSKYMVKPTEAFLGYEAAAKAVTDHRNMLGAWYRLRETIEQIEREGGLPVLNELIRSGCAFEQAKPRLMRTFCQKAINDFIAKNGLTYLRDFDRVEHEKLMRKYAETDRKVLETSAARLCEALEGYLREAAAQYGNGGAEYPRLPSRTDRSIKQYIYENRDYILRIKPCFMMSPLNVSQYVDIGITFDLVIFDEASQIFTEDALAAIVRGKQVIIAGDSKQLPPCDFFRAGESMQDDDDQYYEEEANVENSLLSAADEVLNDASISLTWHYRSCDEALIAFSNQEMDYNLISFPSATRNPNDGIYCESVPYDPATCYDAGKGGTHVNVGEANRIVELIYAEMTHPERHGFSIGVVAFSNSQAFEIESRWEIYKQHPDRKDAIERWEKAHEEEPLIFCNLDTVQGDERDTTILSVCYSADRNGKFSLPYLGRIRLSSGRKRINVAVTRARHRMIVVSTLSSEKLKEAIRSSSAPEENKAGAGMLCDFLEYAQGCSAAIGVRSRQSGDPFVASVCKALDEARLEYDTEIGRSGCKVNIGVRRANEKGNYFMGIIIDDPRRTDFDSAREYSRLTEQVLGMKYGWAIYRIYPTAWINDYEREKQKLMEAIRLAYVAA